MSKQSKSLKYLMADVTNYYFCKEECHLMIYDIFSVIKPKI